MVRAEVVLTHPNEIVQMACVAIVLALRELINNNKPGDIHKAFEVAESFIMQSQ